MPYTVEVEHPRFHSDSALRGILARFTREILSSKECRQHLSVEQVAQMEECLIDGMDVMPLLIEEMFIPFGEDAVKTIEVDFRDPLNPFAKV